MAQEPAHRPDTLRADDDLSDLNWRDFDEILLVRAGDAYGPAIYVKPRLVGDVPRGAQPPQYTPRRLLITVANPAAAGEGKRVRRALGISPDEIGVEGD